jgi:hypothetical protein
VVAYAHHILVGHLFSACAGGLVLAARAVANQHHRREHVLEHVGDDARGSGGDFPI